MPTPHNAAEVSQIAKHVLMPGDPLRAKYIADTFLKDPVLVNNIRSIQGYTGTYEGEKITVMASGMGMPSMGIYCHELFHFYEVENIIRVGSCGAMQPHINLYDVIIAQGACTNSNFVSQFGLKGNYAPIASYALLAKAVTASHQLHIPTFVGNVFSSDIFYNADSEQWKQWAKMNVLAVEMEAAALYMEAAYAKKNALSILTVSDSLVSGKETTAKERELSFNNMIKIALQTCLQK